MLQTSRNALLLIVSGPAGIGKTTVCQKLEDAHSGQLRRVITATSRPPRANEKKGVDYHFLSREQFRQRIETGDFYEHAQVHGRHYGVLKEAIQGPLQEGYDLLLNIDVQGASTFRSAAREDEDLRRRMASVFLMPRGLEQIRNRLEKRGQDPADEIERRLQTAQKEIKQWRYFDYCLFSSDRDEDYAAVEAIYQAEGLRSVRIQDLSP